jgi:hypothetical protein
LSPGYGRGLKHFRIVRLFMLLASRWRRGLGPVAADARAFDRFFAAFLHWERVPVGNLPLHSSKRRCRPAVAWTETWLAQPGGPRDGSQGCLVGNGKGDLRIRTRLQGGFSRMPLEGIRVFLSIFAGAKKTGSFMIWSSSFV